MELDHNFDILKAEVEHTQYIRCKKAIIGPIVAIENVCNLVRHKYCTAIHLGQFSKS